MSMALFFCAERKTIRIVVGLWAQSLPSPFVFRCLGTLGWYLYGTSLTPTPGRMFQVRRYTHALPQAAFVMSSRSYLCTLQCDALVHDGAIFATFVLLFCVAKSTSAITRLSTNSSDPSSSPCTQKHCRPTRTRASGAYTRESTTDGSTLRARRSGTT